MDKDKNEEKEPRWVTPLMIILGALSLLFGAYIINNNISAKRFVKEELPNWSETIAEIKNSVITSKHINVNKDEDGYRSYWINYDFTVVFSTEDGEVSFYKSGEIIGETKGVSIPRFEYDSIPENGQIVSICYDPKNPEGFLFGTKESITRRANGPSYLIVASGAIIFGLILIAVCIPRKKHIKSEHEEHKEHEGE